MKYADGNRALYAGASSADGTPPFKRTQVYLAVQEQIAQDGRRPWRLGQKLNDAPYRYTRDVLWASLLQISKRLDKMQPPIEFPTEGAFVHPSFDSFSAFVNKMLSGSVSDLINGIMAAAKWK
ncbi:hypothetical protein [Sphingobium sp. R-21]|uniref:hypothetical protein n=1 Tax=Sphingobium sp. R-21 TaxID=3404056 RepID=UPI003CFB6EF0